MGAPILPPAEQFLREEVIRAGMDLMYFANSRHLRGADDKLEELGLGRAHHRALHFIGRRPDITVGELLAILGITKQSFGRVAKQLIAKDLVEQRPGQTDRRQRLLRLNANGEALERQLFDELHDNMARAYAASGGEAVAGWWVVSQHLMGAQASEQFAQMYRRTVEG